MSDSVITANHPWVVRPHNLEPTTAISQTSINHSLHSQY